jgi:uncharacterized protein with FMN-binding domain
MTAYEGRPTVMIRRERRRRKNNALAAASVVGFLAGILVLGGCAVAPVLGKKHYEQQLVDGVYRGDYRHGPNSAEVRVRIENGKIAAVELLRHGASWIGKKTNNVIPRRIVKEQATSVDAVSGATNSSNVIMNAAHLAVSKAAAQQH